MNEKINSIVDEISSDITDIALKIWENPELGLQEFKAMGWLTEFAEKNGFEVERGVAGMPTAFVARKRGNNGKKDGARIAFLAEFDALPKIGHGCGHNLIAAASAGAAIALGKLGLDGEILLIGTPAEETAGGKITLLEHGIFDDVDFALMMHPASRGMINRMGLACCAFKINCRGKSAHSAGAWRGVSALQAVLEFFRIIDGMRPYFEDGVRINGIVQEGGTASNIIPEFASAQFTVRSKTTEMLLRVVSRLHDFAKAAALITGAEVVAETAPIMEERYPNQTMEERFKKYSEEQGMDVGYPAPDEIIGSSDIGNVSRRVPSIHSYLGICEVEVNEHSTDFTECARSPLGIRAAITAAKSMASIGYDILTEEEYAEEIYREFEEKVPGQSGALIRYRNKKLRRGDL